MAPTQATLTRTLMIWLVFAALNISTSSATCTEVYTVGDDQLCHLSLASFAESCITLGPDIAATNGLAMDPLTEELYLVASIGTKNGDRVLYRVDESTGSAVLDTVATYSASNDKLVGIAFDCLGDLYGITGSQADHSFYHVDLTDGALTKIADLDASSNGNGLTYDPLDDHFYRVGGSAQLDIEQLDHYTGNVTSDYYVTHVNITGVRAIGHYKDDLILFIDTNERLFELDTLSGDVVVVANLNTTRKHKGIVCTDAASFCDFFTTELPTTSEEEETTSIADVSTTEDAEGDIAVRLCLTWKVVIMSVFAMFCAL